MNQLFNYLMIVFFIVAIFWTFYLRFPQFRLRKELKKINQDQKQSAYQTFLVSLATHIGTGNLIGVTTGLIIGGPGVIFWMWIFAFFSSSLALVENTYAQVFKEKIDGENRGGASYYIKSGLDNRLLSIIFLSSLFLTNTIFFPPLQVNTIVMASNEIFGLNITIIGLLLFLSLSLIVFRGTKKIVKASEKIVPFMAISYTVIVLFLILIDYQSIPYVIKLIIMGAFKAESFNLGFLITVMTLGIKRSLFSNEAGLGTTPSISAMSDVAKPTDQGYFQMLGVFVDTLLMCTITGIFILQRIEDFSNFTSSDIFTVIFVREFGKFGYLISFGFLFIFAFASLIGQYYLGESNALFIIKEIKVSSKMVIFIYRIIFSIGIIIGIYYSTARILSLIDFGLIALGFTNIWVLYKLEKSIKLLIRKRKDGII